MSCLLSLACATCFGRTDSLMAQGMNGGILTLLFILVAVLGGFLSWIVYLALRAKKYS